jgi:FkbM family methyltransferase
MTSIMVRRAGVSGKVYAIEPHPETRKLLSESAALWACSPLPCASVELIPMALSNTSGTAFLEEPEGFQANSGLARISRIGGRCAQQDRAVDTRTFDDLFGKVGKVRVVKVDVEGHEDEVLEGMGNSLASGSIDFIVFEEFRPLPSPACDTLREFNYSTYLIDRDFWGPKLVPTCQSPNQIIGESTNVLAVHSDQSLEGLRSPEWRCLRSRGGP